MGRITDGFKSIMKGLGTSKDPRESVVYQIGNRIDQQTAENLYVYNWLAAKIIDIPIDDATRKWRSLLIADPVEKEETETAFEQFEIKARVSTAFKWARVFGGAGIFCVIEGDDQEEPLAIESIREGSLKNFVVLDRYNIYPGPVNMDVLSVNFGSPDYYMVARGGQKIHHTRIHKVYAQGTTIREFEKNNYWSPSLFTKLFEPVSDSQVCSQSINNMIYESNVDVYKIDGLLKLVAEGKDDVVVSRLKIVNGMKSILNAVVLDSKDEYEKKTNTFASLPDIDDRAMQKVSGASGIPITRLLGISPAGMNATGASDMLNYYDTVQSIQENELRPVIDWMDSVVVASLPGLNEKIDYEFLPLKQMTEVEQADVEFKKAQRDQIYLDHEVITEPDALAELAESGTYTTIDETRVEAERKENELLLGAGDPPDTDPAASLNGAQVTAMLEIVRQVTAEEISKEVGAKVIAASFPMTNEEAMKMLTGGK